jgi:hypothetical protein
MVFDMRKMNNIIIKFKPVYFVYTIVLLIFILYLILNINKIIEIHNNIGYDYSLKSIFRTISFYNVFRLLLLFAIPVIAICYSNKLTWIITLTYFYFLLWQIVAASVFPLTIDSSIELKTILLAIILSLIPIFSIYILNKVNTFKDVYSVEKKSLMLYNLISFILGCSISMFVFITGKSKFYDFF